MRIVFDGTDTGFANNGGTQTIFHAADNLAKLGHDVYCLAQKDIFTWFRLKYAKSVRHRPTTYDVTIATGINSVKHVMYLPAKKLWWIRGWETWAASEMEWLSTIDRFPVLLVNSKAYQNRIKKETGRDSHLVYSGFDFKDYYVEPEVRDRVAKGVGLLYNAKKATKNSKLVLDIASKLYISGVRVFLLGAKVPAVNKNLSVFENPPVHIKRTMYNLCDLWIAVSTSESLHIPPVEAALCGCSLITTGAPFSGTTDYAIDGKTAMVLGKKHCSDPNAYVSAVNTMLLEEKMRVKQATALQKLIRATLPSRVDIAEQIDRIICA